MAKQKWTYEFRAAAIADTGDYEDWVQFTNGNDTLQSSEDISDDDAQQFCDLLNAMPDLWSKKYEDLWVDLHLLRIELQDKIAAAVLAERRRVWGEIEGQIKMAYRESKKEIPYGDSYQSDKAAIMEALLLRLFPDGEPKPTTEESSEDQ